MTSSRSDSHDSVTLGDEESELLLLTGDPVIGLESRRDDFLLFVRSHVGTDTSIWSFWNSLELARSRRNLEKLFLDVCVWFQLGHARVQVETLVERPEGDGETEFYFCREDKQVCGCTAVVSECEARDSRCRLNEIVKCCYEYGRIEDLRYLMMASYLDDMVRALCRQRLVGHTATWKLASMFKWIFKTEWERLWVNRPTTRDTQNGVRDSFSV